MTKRLPDPIHRRRVALALAALPFTSLRAEAQATFPSRPVTLIIPWAPGGVVDLVGRRIAQRLGEVWDQSVVVVNQAGGGGNTGAATVARARGDGFTLLLTLHDGLVIARAAQMKLGFDPLVDLAPVGLVGPSVTSLVVRQDSPFKSFADLIAQAKASPGKFSFGGNGTGTSFHFGLERLATEAGISILYVPYRSGAPAMLDVLAGRVDMMFATVPLAKPYLEAGSIRALAIANAERSELFPGVPTIAESGYPGFEIPTGVGVGLFAPASTPAALVNRLNADLGRAIADPATSGWLRSVGIFPQSMTPEQYRSRLLAEASNIEGLIRKFDIKLD